MPRRGKGPAPVLDVIGRFRPDVLDGLRAILADEDTTLDEAAAFMQANDEPVSRETIRRWWKREQERAAS